MEKHENRVILAEGSFWREEIRRINLGTQESILAQCVNHAAHNVYAIGPGMHGQAIHQITQKDGSGCLYSFIDKLPMDMVFKAILDTSAKPEIRKAPTTPEQRVEMERINHQREEAGLERLPVPKEMDVEVYPIKCYLPFLDNRPVSMILQDRDLYDKEPIVWPSDLGRLMFCVTYKTAVNTVATVTNCYLFCYYNDELWKIPYTNVFNDGRICMGPEWETNKTGGARNLIAIFNHCYYSFMTTRANADLASGQFNELFTRNPDKTYRLTTDTEFREAYKANWKHHSFMVSPAFMIGVVLPG